MLIKTYPYCTLIKPGIQVVLLSAAIIIGGCNEEAPVENTSAEARISGKVIATENTGSINKINVNVSGASISLMKITPSGSLEKVPGGNITTDFKGEFTFETSYTGSSELVIVAEKDGKSWKAILTSELKAGITVYSQPLTLESTIETELYIQAKNKRYTNISYADISVFINSEIASRLINDSNSRDILLQAFEQAAYVQALVITKGELGGDVNKWKAAISFFSEGQATLERDLYFSDSESKSEAAVKKYLGSRVFACKNAGIDAALYYNSIALALKVFLNANTYLGSEYKFLLNKQSAFIKSIFLRYAVEENFAGLGSVRVVVNAGDALQNKIKSAKSEMELNDGFDTYKTAIISYLKTTPGTSLDLVTNALFIIEEAAKEFWITVKPGISLNEVAELYVKYYSLVKTTLENMVLFTDGIKKQNILSILFISGSSYKI